MSQINVKNKVKGVLIGGAVGDAMGMPTEGWSFERIKDVFPNGVKEFFTSIVSDDFPRKFEAGAITDDTINSLMILDSIVANNGKLNAEDYVTKLIEWHETSGISELVSGPTTLIALERIQKGVPINQTGKFGVTNGAAMKIAPIGLISSYLDLPELINNVEQICLPTHYTNVAISGASVVAAAISYSLSEEAKIENLWELAETTLAYCKGKGTDFPTPSLSYRINKAKYIVERYSKEEAILHLYQEIGTGVTTIETIPTVLAIVQLAEGNPLYAAQISASIGGDTDTIGAISAAICGGFNPINDANIITFIEKTNELNFDELAESILPFVR